MAFDGAPITTLSGLRLTHRSCDLLIVSGSGPNLAGHMLMELPAEPGGTRSVFHIAAVHDYPYWMAASEFPRYLKENGKTLLGRKTVPLPKPAEAEAYLAAAIGKKWFWGLVYNNCVSFCEEYIAAGGSTWSMRTNLPALYDTTRPDDYIGNWLSDVYRRADNEVRRIYGFPF
ncbi:MAG: hypothetical protein ACK4ST_15550 [Elioraea tepidiphila]